jgi:hypothetical protein
MYMRQILPSGCLQLSGFTILSKGKGKVRNTLLENTLPEKDLEKEYDTGTLKSVH